MNNSTNNAIRFPRFLFPLLYRAKRAEHKNIFLRFIISRIRGNDCCCCVKSYNNNNLHSEFFFFYPFAFILYNFFTRYIYISKFLFFFSPTKFIKRKQSGWALTGINWPRSKSNYPFLGWISPDRNFWINPRWGYHISILA